MKNKIKTLEELKPIVEELKKRGKKIVWTNGVFDLLHVGHIRYLQEARTLGDVLLVGLNTDSSVKSFKEPKRPIIPEDQRAEILAALECVDYIVKYSDRLPNRLITELKPDIDVKGGDYTIDQMPEADVVKSYGGEVKIIKLIEGVSVTKIIQTILERYKE